MVCVATTVGGSEMEKEKYSVSKNIIFHSNALILI